MALSDSEAAVLEIEVDTESFDSDMSTIEARAERAAKAQTRATEREQKKQAIAVAAGIVAWKKLFDFMEQGTGETAKGIARITENVAAFKTALATAIGQSAGMRTIVGALEEITSAARRSTGFVNGLGDALGNLASGPAAIIGAISDLASGGADTRRRVLQQMSERATALEAGDISMQAEAGAQRQAGYADVARMMQEDEAGAVQRAQAIADREHAAFLRGGRERAGGGGGAEALGESPTDTFERNAAARQAFDDQMKALEQQGEDRRLAQEEMVRQRRESMQATELEKARAQQEYLEQFEMERWQRTEEAGVRAEGRKREAIEATIAAMEMSAAALAKGGPAARAAGRAIELALAAVAGIKAAFEVAEAIAAAARYDWPSAALHASAAISYGIVAGQKASAALGGGGSGRADARSLGGGLAPSRNGASEGGGGPMNVTLVLNAAGEIVDDSALRRLGNAVRELERRGYAGRYA